MNLIDLDVNGQSTPLQESVDALSFRRLGLVPRHTPDFNFIEFFSGHTRANGWFCDRFGEPRRHFCGDFYGEQFGNRLDLHEELHFTDGITEQRLWTVEVGDTGRFTAESDTLVGNAVGLLQGSTLRMKYRMRVMVKDSKYWKLAMRDTMILQSDGSLHNITQVYKWGVRIGSVSAMYLKHSG